MPGKDTRAKWWSKVSALGVAGVGLLACCGFVAILGRDHRWNPVPLEKVPEGGKKIPSSTAGGRGSLPREARASGDAFAPESDVAQVRAEISRDRTQLLSKLRVWAMNEPEAALAEARQAPEGEQRSEALAAVCFGVAQNDPAAAVKLAKSLNLSGGPGAIIESLVQQWAARDWPAALAWVSEQPAGGPRDGAMARLAFVLSQSNPSDAAQLVTGQIPPGTDQDEAVMTVVHQWGERDAAAAAAWVGTFPDGALRQRASQELRGMAQSR